MSETNIYSKNSGMITDFECCKNKIPETYNTPFYETKFASNNNNDQYGNSEISYSTMRKNYKERIMHIMNDKTNESGISTGGGEYVVPKYSPVDTTLYRTNYDLYGYQKFNIAYGSTNNGSCKIHYADY